jgi:oxidase EvaA
MMQHILPWLEAHRGRLAGTAEPIAWEASREWSMQEGRLVHKSGGFFSVAGLNVAAPGQYFDGIDMPIIDQPEIGLLGFVICPREDGTDWLLQAKSEPGSVRWVQVGPSVQATRSNYLRRHNGKPTEFLALFFAGGSDAPVGTDHSEQGSRFLGKYNRNAVVEVPERFDPGAPEWAWFSDAALRRALGEDFAINTDARSVIVTGDWRRLRKDAPLFTGDCPEAEGLARLRADLAASCAAPEGGSVRFLSALEQKRAREKVTWSFRSLDVLPGWRLTCDSLAAEEDGWGADVEFRMFKVRAPGREVEAWDQPFSIGKKRHRAGLVLAMRGGVLRAALRYADEPGFLGRTQLGPSFQTDAPCPRAFAEIALEGESAPVLSVAQSDEGGRFMSSVVDYEIHDLTHVPERCLPDECDAFVWLTMAELRRISRRRDALTNEARSAVSVLLSLA